jgi:hypothetical protein
VGEVELKGKVKGGKLTIKQGKNKNKSPIHR